MKLCRDRRTRIKAINHIKEAIQSKTFSMWISPGVSSSRCSITSQFLSVLVSVRTSSPPSFFSPWRKPGPRTNYMCKCELRRPSTILFLLTFNVNLWTPAASFPLEQPIRLPLLDMTERNISCKWNASCYQWMLTLPRTKSRTVGSLPLTDRHSDTKLY